MRATVVIPKGYRRVPPRQARHTDRILCMEPHPSWVLLCGSADNLTQGIVIRRIEGSPTQSYPPGLIIPGFPPPKGRRWLRASSKLAPGDYLHDTDPLHACNDPIDPEDYGKQAQAPIITGPVGAASILHYSRALGA